MRTCRRHPRMQAGWTCSGCKTDLCPDCVAKLPAGARGKPVTVCCTCGRGVTQITLHRKVAEPFTQRMWSAFGFPLGSTGIISLAFVGFVRALTSYAGAASMMGIGAYALRQGLYWAFVFFIIRSVANGERRMGVFGFTDIQSDIIAPGVKGVFSTAILWLPAVIYMYMAADSGLMGLLTYPVREDPTVWLIALMGALYVPMALLAAATDLGFGHILNPIFIARCIFRIGRDYFIAVLVIAVILAIGTGASGLVGLLTKVLPVPFLGRWISLTVDLYGPFVAAGVLGNLLYLHGEVLDWGRSEEYEVPLLRGVEPRGHVRPKPMPGREVKPDPAPISPPTFDSSFTPSVAQPHRPPMSPPVLDDPAPAQVAAPPAANLDVTSGLASLLNLSSALAPDAQSQPAPAPPVAPASPPEAPKLRLGPDVVLPNQLPPALADADDKPPSMLKYGIELPSGILEAQAFYEPDGSAPVDLPPAPPSVPAMPQAESAPAQPVAGEAPQSDAGAAAPPLESAPAGATVIQHQSPVVPGAAAPTMMGFTPALPDTEASTTKLGHQAVHVQTPPSDKKG